MASAVKSELNIATSIKCPELYTALIGRDPLARGACGPTIFLMGLTASVLPVSTPRFIPGRPSMLHAFLNAQYLYTCHISKTKKINQINE